MLAEVRSHERGSFVHEPGGTVPGARQVLHGTHGFLPSRRAELERLSEAYAGLDVLTAVHFQPTFGEEVMTRGSLL